MEDHTASFLDADDSSLRPARRRAQEQPNQGEPLWVEKPEVKEVLETETGRHLLVAEVMGNTTTLLTGNC